MMVRFTRNLFVSAPMLRGEDVRAVQRIVFGAGQEDKHDGLYGIATCEAVKAFQRSKGLDADGVVGVATWSALFGDGRLGAPSHPDLVVTDILTPERLKALHTPHSRYGDGCRWSVRREGLSIHQGDADGERVRFAPGEERLARAVLKNFNQSLVYVLAKVQVPIELVVACICTESSGRPDAVRLEPGADTSNPGRTPGRVSIGLMQTLLSTAREALGQPTLRFADLLKPDVSINAGTSYMWLQARETGFDPPLVAAAYNAGGVRYEGSAANRWKLVQYPLRTSAHVDRFVAYFNASLIAVADASLPASVPTFRGLLS